MIVVIGLWQILSSISQVVVYRKVDVVDVSVFIRQYQIEQV